MSDKPLERLFERGPERYRPRLQALQDRLAVLGLETLPFTSIQIAGTNGKGSTAAMTAALLEAAGRRVGLYTSPHLLRLGERVRINGLMAADHTLLDAIERVDGGELSFFETLTAAALLLFAEAEIEIAVLEVGLGGRFDATRVAKPAIVALSNVGSDHAEILGDTRAKIAADKGAALGAAQIAVLGPAVDQAIRPYLGLSTTRDACDLISGSTRQLLELDPPWPGQHQRDNLELAIGLVAAAVELGWTQAPARAEAREALASIDWPGRLQHLRLGDRELLLDGAHNLESVEALVTWLRSPDTRYDLVFSCLDDKPVEAMAALLIPMVGRIAIYELDDDRAMALDRIQSAFPMAMTASDLAAAISRLDGPILACGSLRVVADTLRLEGL